MSQLRRESATPDVDYIVNAIEVLLVAVVRLVGAVVALPFRLLCSWKGRQTPGSSTGKCN
jgi:hypothetical protein